MKEIKNGMWPCLKTLFLGKFANYLDENKISNSGYLELSSAKWFSQLLWISIGTFLVIKLGMTSPKI